MTNNTFDFYDKTSLKSYNLDESMRYQLNMLGNLYLQKSYKSLVN